MKAKKLKAPFPWFGGKSRVAPLIWERLGDVDNFIVPFAGSCAELLARPHAPRIETVNDFDCMVANFWRATGKDPEAVVDHCDWPVNEADLHSRHRWLVLSPEAAAFRERMRTDPEYFDAKFAGWWCWGLCCWIGGGWCTAHWETADGDRKECIPTLHAKRPRAHSEFGNSLPGVNGDCPDGHRPQLADAYSRGRGVNGNDAAGTCAQRRAWLLDWFGRLRDRFRTVRVCCGDWQRVCDSESVTTRLGITGLSIDPPYALDLERLAAWIKNLRGEGPEPPAKTKAGKNRDANLYATDHSSDVDHLVARVHVYCLERGSDTKMKIALCGYEGEHDALEAHGWECVAWESQGGYGNRSAKGKANAKRERIWFSPHCLIQRGLFEGMQ